MVKSIRHFLEFCYHVRAPSIDEDDITGVRGAIDSFHQERIIFKDEGVRPDGFSLPRQHSIPHYPDLILDFAAPNGLCLSITESKHIKAVKEPW